MVGVSGTRVLFVAPSFPGHLHPVLGLARAMQGRGFSCSIATGVAAASVVGAEGLAVHPVLVDDPGAFSRIGDTDRPVRSNPLRLVAQLRQTLHLQLRLLDELDAVVRRVRPHVVVADFVAVVAGVVAQRHDLPWITTMPTPFAVETRTGTPAYCGGWAPPRHLGEQVRDAAGRLATRTLKLSVQTFLRRDLAPFGGRVYRPDGSEVAYSDRCILGLGSPRVEFDRDWPAHHALVGPVLDDVRHVGDGGTAALDALLERTRGPVVLVTLGSHLPWARQGVERDVLALAAANPAVTFVLSQGRAGAGGPTSIAPTVHRVPFVPYRTHLRRFTAVVHHGGPGAGYQAIAAQVPAVVVPQDYDQFDFAARFEACGAATRVRALRGARARDALRWALDADHAGLHDLAAHVRGLDPAAALEHRLRESAG